MSFSARAASASASSAITVMKARSDSFSDAIRSRQARVSSTGEISFCSSRLAASRRLPGVVIILGGLEMPSGRMAELRVGIAQRLQRSCERLQERLERGQGAGLRIGGRAGQPLGQVVRHQKVSVPRTVIGIMCTLWATGVEKRLITYLNARSTPNGPEDTPPPPSAK